MNVWRIGLRSVVRNRRRSVVTTGAVAFAGFIMILYSDLMEGFIVTMERNALSMDIADLQVHTPGYRRDPDLYKRIDNAEALVRRIEREGFDAAPRLSAVGLAAAGISSAGVILRGVDVPRERSVTRIHTHMGEGSWLDPTRPTGVVLGKKLARSLRVDVGDEVVVLSQGADGSTANDLYEVRGVLKPIGEFVDRAGLFMIESAFRELMVVPDGAHEIAVRRPDRSLALDDAVARVAALAEGEETLGWKELHPMLARTIESSFASQLFMLLITYAAIGSVVLNATLMSVFERIREFGIMKALGVSPRQVLAIVMVEVSAQALVASVVAVGLGLPLAYRLQRVGIDLTAFQGDTSIMGVALDPIWYCQVNWNSVGVPVLVLWIFVLVSALYPGLKAAALRPVQALRHL